MGDFRIETNRLVLREWREGDVDPFEAMFLDPEVMAHLGPTLDPKGSRSEVASVIVRLQAIQAAHGCCFWALARRDTSEMIGFCGVEPGPAGTPIENKLEIGWRLARSAWSQGFAQEAARATLGWVWQNRDNDAVWAITTPTNVRSQRLMERIGMMRMPDLDFDHPGVPEGSDLKRHVTYRLRRC